MQPSNFRAECQTYYYKKRSSDILSNLQMLRIGVLIISKLELTGNELFY